MSEKTEESVVEKNGLPMVRMLYQHITGHVFVVAGIAKHHKDNSRIVILSSVNDASLVYCPLIDFYDARPSDGKPRYQLVTQKDINVVP